VGNHAVASAVAGDLVNLLRDGQRLHEALAEVERKATLTVQAGLGPWTQLGDQGMRLRILAALGRQEEVLSEVNRLRDQMAGLPKQPGLNERVRSWNVREILLEVGFFAARDLERRQEALALLDEDVESKRQRGAGRLEVARTRFNACGSLIRLRRVGEAHELLLECQRTFSQENDLRLLGNVLSARADLEEELGHRAEAVELEEHALRFKYLAGNVAGIAVSHFNLANYLERAGRRPDALLHRLAAALIDFQAESGGLASTLTALGQDLAEAAAPTSFAELCAAVERWRASASASSSRPSPRAPPPRTTPWPRSSHWPASRRTVSVTDERAPAAHDPGVNGGPV
jgi:tetratricopeptide (TPR) repeat protein